MPNPKRNTLPSREELSRYFDYNPETGELLWKSRTSDMFRKETGRSANHACNQWNSRWANKPALNKEWRGYRIGRLNYQYVAAHRVIWKLVTGNDPDIIDHIDGDGLNNRFGNLRDVTERGNKRNLPTRRDNKHGAMGVRFDKKRSKWIATIQIGTFDSLEEAISARKDAEASLGYHPNHGRK